MSKTRRSYSREFKQEAVKLVLEGGISVARAARDLRACQKALCGAGRRIMNKTPRGLFRVRGI